MENLINNIQNNALAALSQKASGSVVSAIQKASTKTGVNFAYMLQQAKAESSFNPEAKAKTSSAQGLYQFIERTWLSTVERYGEKHGLETDGKSRAEILEMRNEPKAASLMAAEFASENQRFLQNNWKGAKEGQEIGSTELYFAHFMGASGAAAFLNARDENPMEQAALIFPKAAKANRNVFYDTQTGRPKTMDEVYGFFDKKFQIEGEGNPRAINTAPTDTSPVSPKNTRPATETIMAQAPIRPQSAVFLDRLNTPMPQHPLFEQFTRPDPVSQLSAYQNMLKNPIDLMLIAQLDVPLANSKSKDDRDFF